MTDISKSELERVVENTEPVSDRFLVMLDDPPPAQGLIVVPKKTRYASRTGMVVKCGPCVHPDIYTGRRVIITDHATKLSTDIAEQDDRLRICSYMDVQCFVKPSLAPTESAEAH